jgi:hypothetical protein
MKKLVFRIIPLLMVLMGCASGGTAVANGNSPGMDLDAAIKEAATQMGDNLPRGTKVALISVASSSAQLSDYVISRLEAALVSGKKLVVVDRANLDKVRAEQGFQASGEVDDDSAKSIGKMLGAGAIVTGAFADLGDVHSLTLKAINIETATVAVSYPADVAKSTRIETLLASGGGAGSGPRTAQAGGGTASAATPAYKIGDTGPAGGLIFYDKGNSSGGWRYMEAAPEDFGSKLFSTRENIGFNTGRPVGQGKTNTQAIMKEANNRGGGFGWAAQACDTLEVNGFDDWFLPSRDELNYMYGNLHLQGLGNFVDGWYLSSTCYGEHTNYSFTPATVYNWWVVNFSDGEHSGSRHHTPNNVRAIRQF